MPPLRAAGEQIFALLGTDEVRANRVLDSLEFEPDQSHIFCPLLVMHGGADPLVTEEEQQRFIYGADGATAQLRVWADGEHTLDNHAYNHAAERNAFTADWFTDQLLRRTANHSDLPVP